MASPHPREDAARAWCDRVVAPLHACSLETCAPVPAAPGRAPRDGGGTPRATLLPLVVGCYQLDEGGAAGAATAAPEPLAASHPSATLRAVILDPGAYKTGVSVTGTVVYADLSLGRIDVADAGAKLVVDVSRIDPAATAGLREGSAVTAGGAVRRRQRRMFLDATRLSVEGDEEEEGEERVRKPRRSGELRLYAIPSSSSAATEREPTEGGAAPRHWSFGEACAVPMESGVLDGKWRRRGARPPPSGEGGDGRLPLFASACASGRIHLHALEHTLSQPPGLSLRGLASSDAPPAPAAGTSPLCLALAWNDFLDACEAAASGADTDQIVSSYSDGTVALHAVTCAPPEEGGAGRGDAAVEETHRWKAHALFGCPAEAWTCSFLRGHPHAVLSGADDCALKLWDVRLVGQGPAPKPTHTVGTSEFDAGVTAISAHPALDHVFAVGSYDEHVRIYDARTLARPLAKTPVGGGVWRLKWHPSGWEGALHDRGRLLVAAMHGGCRVLDVPGLGAPADGGAPAVDTLSTFTAHDSMAYGADWAWFDRSTSEAVASCSFYDNQAFLWDPCGQR